MKPVWSVEIRHDKGASNHIANNFESILTSEFNSDTGRYEPHLNASLPGFSKSVIDASVRDPGNLPWDKEWLNTSNI